MKKKKKEIHIPVVVLVLIVVVVIVGIIVCLNNPTKDKPSNQPSETSEVEKIQARIEVINQEIEQKQEKMKVELEKLNQLYEESVISKNP